MAESEAVIERKLKIHVSSPEIIPASPRSAAHALHSFLRTYRMMSRTHKENLGEHITFKYHADLLPKNEDEPAISIFAHVSKNGIKIGAKSKHGEIIREIPWTKLDFRNSFKSINALEEEIRRIEEKLVSSAIKGNDEYYRNVIFHMHGTPVSNTLRLLAREMDRNIIENVLRAHIDAGVFGRNCSKKICYQKEHARNPFVRCKFSHILRTEKRRYQRISRP